MSLNENPANVNDSLGYTVGRNLTEGIGPAYQSRYFDFGKPQAWLPKN